MTNFLRESARFMAADRPDVYNTETAFEDLSVVVDDMQSREGSGWHSFADSFLLIKDADPDFTEWQLTRKLSSAILFYEDDAVDAMVYGHTKGSGTLKFGVNLPSPIDSTD